LVSPCRSPAPAHFFVVIRPRSAPGFEGDRTERTGDAVSRVGPIKPCPPLYSAQELTRNTVATLLAAGMTMWISMFFRELRARGGLGDAGKDRLRLKIFPGRPGAGLIFLGLVFGAEQIEQGLHGIEGYLRNLDDVSDPSGHAAVPQPG